MLNFQAAQLMHRHDDTWVPMTEVPHSPQDVDPERAMLHGEQVIFRCAECDEEVAVDKNRD